MSHPVKVLMLGLDAADCDVVLDLIEKGNLPNLERLLNNGVFGQLSTPASHYAGGVWPSFYTGQSVPWHGIFHNKLWRPEAMRIEVPTDAWLEARPFWESLGDAGVNVCVIDVPMVLGQPRPVNGAYVAGWGTHDLINKGSWPTTLWHDLESQFGPPRMPREYFGRQTLSSLSRLTHQLLSTTDQLRDISVELLRNNAWQFACIVLGAVHRAGHYLWDLSQVEDTNQKSRDIAVLKLAMTEIYKNTDTAIGSIIDELPRDTLLIVFAVHGMGPNPGWSDLLSDILAKIETCRTGVSKKYGLLYSMKQRVPYHWVRPLLTRLPGTITDRLVSIWSQRMYDWSQTRFFPMPMDEAGYLRINLCGRESDGIVKPGAEYDELCQQIEILIAGLRDEATGKPIAGKIVRGYQDADAAAPCREVIPDLIVSWNGPTATDTQRLVLEGLPEFIYEVPHPLPSGRSGNHTDKAWFIAHGPGIASARLDEKHSILDLLPTVLKYLGVTLPGDIQGRAMEFGAPK